MAALTGRTTIGGAPSSRSSKSGTFGSGCTRASATSASLRTKYTWRRAKSRLNLVSLEPGQVRVVGSQQFLCCSALSFSSPIACFQNHRHASAISAASPSEICQSALPFGCVSRLRRARVLLKDSHSWSPVGRSRAIPYAFARCLNANRTLAREGPYIVFSRGPFSPISNVLSRSHASSASVTSYCLASTRVSTSRLNVQARASTVVTHARTT